MKVNANISSTNLKRKKNVFGSFDLNDGSDSLYSDRKSKKEKKEPPKANLLSPRKNQSISKAKVKPWSIISEPAYSGSVDQSEFPKTPLDKLDYEKRLTFDGLKNNKLRAMSQWKIKDTKGLKKAAYIKDI